VCRLPRAVKDQRIQEARTVISIHVDIGSGTAVSILGLSTCRNLN
jgi:hypothetical protein